MSYLLWQIFKSENPPQTVVQLYQVVYIAYTGHQCMQGDQVYARGLGIHEGTTMVPPTYTWSPCVNEHYRSIALGIISLLNVLGLLLYGLFSLFDLFGAQRTSMFCQSAAFF